MHNVHAYERTRTIFNRAQPPKAADIERIANSRDVIKLKCDVHPWMTAHLHVLDHPYFAVTDEDGRFRIEGLAPGDYRIEAWHEVLGTQRARVRVEQGTASTELTYQAPEEM